MRVSWCCCCYWLKKMQVAIGTIAVVGFLRRIDVGRRCCCCASLTTGGCCLSCRRERLLLLLRLGIVCAVPMTMSVIRRCCCYYCCGGGVYCCYCSPAAAVIVEDCAISDDVHAMNSSKLRCYYRQLRMCRRRHGVEHADCDSGCDVQTHPSQTTVVAVIRTNDPAPM